MKLGEPPEPQELAQVEPEIRVLAPDTRLWRVYFRSGPYPAGWLEFRDHGPTTGRFDHHIPLDPKVRRIHLPGSSREIFYAALHSRTCLAEVFQDTRTIDRATRNPWIATFDLVGPLRLLDLTGLWPTRTGKASQAITSGPRPTCQRWSRAIYEAYPEIHGLCYASSMAGGAPCVALYERAKATGSLPAAPRFHRALSDPSWLAVLRVAAKELGYRLV